jgi:hypothetical protein
MTQSLFHDPTIRMEKVAYSTRIDDDVEEWPTAVVRESYKQLPFLKSFETEVELDRVDSSRGFGVGKMLVWPARMEKGAAAKQRQLVTVPVIIRNREMAPLDVYTYMDNMLPMDQDKLAQVLFRPQVFEPRRRKEAFMGTDISSQITPPDRGSQVPSASMGKHGHVKEAGWFGRKRKKRGSAAPRELIGHFRLPVYDGDPSVGKVVDHYMHPVYKNEAPGITMSSEAQFIPLKKQASVLEGTMHTYRRSDVDATLQKIASHHGVRHVFRTNRDLHAAVQALSGVHEKTAAEKHASTMANLRPTTVQIRKTEGGFLVKTANHRFYKPEQTLASVFDVQELTTEDAFQQLMETGRVTYTTEPAASGHTVKQASVADRVGIYQTYEAGQSAEGLVVPHVVDFNNQPLGLQLYVGEETHALQEKVAGVFVRDVKIESDHPRGVGAFIYQEGGQALAYEPVRIDHKVKIAGDTRFEATRLATGEQIHISIVPGLRKAASVGNHVHLPPSVRFVALGKSAKVAESPADVEAFAYEKTASTESVTLLSDGVSYSLRGENAQGMDRDFLSEEETEFALAALGLTGPQSQALMKTAAARGKAVAAHTRPVLNWQTRGMDVMRKTASALSGLSSVPRADLTRELAVLCSPQAQGLWKQASVILSKETADSILSLGFVTPENASLYVNYLPDLEKVAGKLAELLVASRLGMDDVRESAAKNAMTQVNAVIRGLENLRGRIE